jgi:hypothetical protein
LKSSIGDHVVKKVAQFNGTSTYITNLFHSSGRLTETSLRNGTNVVLNRHASTYNKQR